jgi:hypothetical protein
MQAPDIRRLMLGITITLVAVACSRTADNPYTRLEDPPLVRATLHTVAVVCDSDAAAASITSAGFSEAPLPPNYQRADQVEASLWDVPEPVAARVRHFMASKPGMPNLRLLVMPLAARGRTADADADADVNAAFFRNVLGTTVPEWPLPGKPDDNHRIQVWTYLVPSLVEASKRLRENGIAVVYDPVSITTAYFGTHSTLAIRAPDGTVVQLVETAAQ